MKDLTIKEQKVFELICINPQISQDELAKQLNITRSSVSVHISNLLKKRYLEGKGYIINRDDKVVVVGASMIDIVGRSFDSLIQKDSNPGFIRVSPGGVSRNISENMARLGLHVSLITALCEDSFAQVIKESCAKASIDISDSFILAGGVTTAYLAILGDDGDMALALSDTEALDQFPVEHIIKKEHVLKSSRVIVVDAALPDDVMDYILANFKNQAIFVDPVSVGKARSIKSKIGSFHTLKCNKLEAEYLSDVTIYDQSDVKKAARTLQKIGVKNVFITLGNDGVYYLTKEESGFIASQPAEIKNATGAGDAFMAGIVYGYLKELTTLDAVKFATTLSAIALESVHTVNPNITTRNVQERMETL
jgi:pseudouridine kinase